MMGILTCVIGTGAKWEEKKNLISKRLIENIYRGEGSRSPALLLVKYHVQSQDTSK